jgi:hypothetical protein
MTKSKLPVAVKIILIFIASAIIAWFTRKIFADLYVTVMQPKVVPPKLFMIGPTFIFNMLGYFLSYSLFSSVSSFLFINKKQWWGWLIVIAPLLIISWGMWEMYLWYIVLCALGFGIAWVIREIAPVK